MRKKESEMNLEEKLAYYKELSVEERLAKLEEKVETLIARVEVAELANERVTYAFKQITELEEPPEGLLVARTQISP